MVVYNVFVLIFLLGAGAAASPEETRLADALPSAKTSTSSVSRQTNEEVPSELIFCEGNLKAADKMSDQKDLYLDKDEFGAFVFLQSEGKVTDPLSDFDFVAIFFSQACRQCFELTQDPSCCVGPKAGIVLDHLVLAWDDYLDVLFYMCNSVDLQISIMFPSVPSSSPGYSPISRTPTEAPSMNPFERNTMAPSVRPTITQTPNPSVTNRPTLTPSNQTHGSPSTPPMKLPQFNSTTSPTQRPTETSTSPSIPPSKFPSAIPSISESPSLETTR